MCTLLFASYWRPLSSSFPLFLSPHSHISLAINPPNRFSMATPMQSLQTMPRGFLGLRPRETPSKVAPPPPFHRSPPFSHVAFSIATSLIAIKIIPDIKPLTLIID